MQTIDASIPSLIAACYYIMVAAACLFAVLSGRLSQPEKGRARFWLLASMGMLILSAIRFLDLEDWSRGELRSAMASLELLETKFAFQAPAAALIVATGIGLIWLVLRSSRAAGRHDRLETAVTAGKLALVGLFALLSLRIVSLHFVDAILFTRFLGPIRLNWILDIGLTTLLAGAAIRFASISRDMR